MARRAQSIEELDARINRMISEDGIAHALAFRPRPTDVIIATYAKAGTTWMQQIVHGLRTGGDMNFAEITEAVPWIELAYDCGWDLDADQKAPPRAFKSHWDAAQVPAGCRYINVVRDPRDTMMSFYHFLDGWFLERGAVDPDRFTDWVIDYGPPFTNYWDHLLSWWRRRDDPDVLMLSFEGMKEDLPGVVRRVAGFIGLEDEDAIAVATEQARFSFMKAHEDQFDDHLVARARNAALGLPPDAGSSKVQRGTVGGHEALGAGTLDRLARQWSKKVQPETGLADYAALRRILDGAMRP